MRMPKKILSSVLSAALVAGLVPASPSGALAEDEPVQLGAEPVVAEADAADPPLLEVTEEDPDLNVAEQTTGESIPAQDDEPALGDGIELPASTASAQDDVLEAQAITYSQPATHTKQQIKSFIESHPFDVASPSTYAIEPSITSPYAPGTLSGDSTQNALNALNSLRYIAGVGYNVTNNTNYQSYAQAAALVNKVNGSLSHYPSQPAGMDSTLYQCGYSGAGNSNIAYGYTNAAKSIIQYFDDLGSNNSGTAGHRRWLISSRLGQVGVGQVSNFNATYVSDSSNSSYVTDVAWPARCMPTGLIDTDAQWSFSTVTQNIGTASSISVRVVRRRDGKVWNLSSSNITVNEVSEYGYFVGYDMNGCIVWSMPDVGAYLDGDVYDVTISGNKSSKSYSVEFFDLYSVDDIKISAPDGTALQNGATHEVIISAGMQRFAFFPGFTSGTYPTQPGLQTLADDARWSQTVTYTSSNESVATIAPQASHEYYTFYNNERVMCDWLANITPKGIGTTTITATLSNGVSKSIKLVVKKKSINPDADKRAQVSSYGTLTFTYNGSPQHPTFYVYYNGSTLKEGRDYQITYANNTNAGTATATLTGIGDYDGTVRREFAIARANLANAAIASIGSRSYTGSAITPTLAVTMNGRSLVAGTDYDAVYAQNTNVGTAGVTLTGRGNFSGTATASFKVVAKSITPAVSLSPTSYTYDGSAKTPTVTVKDGNKTLAKDTDYTVSYTSGRTNVGTYKATVTLKGNYAGTGTASFSIGARDLSSAKVAQIAKQTYTGAEIKPAPTVTLGNKTLVAGTDYSVTYAKNTGKGTANVTVVGKGNYKGETATTFTIDSAPISGAAIAKVGSLTYTGKALTPIPVLTFGGKKLASGTDYTVAYEKNTNAGTATIRISGKGNFSGSTSTTFAIAKAPIANARVQVVSSQTYLGEERRPSVLATFGEIPLVEGIDYMLSYRNNVDVGTATVTLTGKGNFQGTTDVEFAVAIPFVDVAMQTGHVEDICWLYETAISQGWTMAQGREFRPYANVARADMAAFLFRLAVRWDIVGNDWQPTGSASFGDVTSSTAHYREIMWLAEEGISKGWTMKGGAVEFRPYANVARADMAAFLSRLYERRFFSDVDDHEGESLLAEAQLVATANGFSDVNSDTAHYDEIMWLAEEGISKGWTMKDGTVDFRPYANVARADMAAFLHRLSNLTE